jgi:flavin reductase (DIM6/NTAB) family NADH-FMN oxidoreductase RutF
MRVPVELRRSYKLLNHGPTTLIASAHGDRVNVMAAAWVMPLDFEPPKLVAVISSETYTRQLVEASGELTVNVPTAAMAELTMVVGRVSGRDEDKIAKHGIRTAPATQVRAPLIEGCAAWLECRVLPEAEISKRYDLFVLEVLAAWADDEVFVNGSWQFTRAEHRTIHHLSAGHFLVIGDLLRAAR